MTTRQKRSDLLAANIEDLAYSLGSWHMQCCASAKLASYLQYTVVYYKTTRCKPHMERSLLWLLEPERVEKASVCIVADQQS